jgi:transposase
MVRRSASVLPIIEPEFSCARVAEHEKENPMSQKPRKHYTPLEKVAILREHLLEGKAVSEVCERHELQPTVFYAWQKQFFENGAAAFERRNKRAEETKDRAIAALQEKLAKKNEVIAELMEENVQSKKALGGL